MLRAVGGIRVRVRTKHKGREAHTSTFAFEMLTKIRALPLIVTPPTVCWPYASPAESLESLQNTSKGIDLR